MLRRTVAILALFLAAQSAIAEDFHAEMTEGRTLTGTLEISSGRLLLRESKDKAVAVDFSKLLRLAPASAALATRPAPPTPSEVRVGLPVGELSVQTDGDKLAIRGDSGEIEGSGESMRLYGWKRGGECDLSAQLLSVKADGTPGREAGGIMVRRDDGGQSPFVAVALDNAGACRVLFRREMFQMPETFPLAEGAGAFFRIARGQHRTRVLASPDGKAWREAWSMPMEARENSCAGAFVSSRAGLATAALASLRYDPSSQAVAPSPGVMLVGGSFIAGNVLEVDAEMVRMVGHDHEAMLTRASVAWFCTDRLTRLDLARLTRAGEAVLLRNDDLMEGRLVKFKDRAAWVETLLFGEREIDPGGGWLAVSLRPEAPAPARFAVTTTIDDVLRCNALSVADDKLQLDAPDLPEKSRHLQPYRIREIRAVR